MTEKSDILLEVSDLDVRFNTEEGEIRAVDGATFSVRKGRTLGIVGESGCGKSVTAFSIMQLQAPGRIMGGTILFHDGDRGTIDITALNDNSPELRQLRGGKIGMIFQEPMSALFPLTTIGSQMIEGILLHRNVGKKGAREIAIALLGKVGIPSPDRRIDQFIHELSGGMRQRAVIAMALSCHPALIIADEPTTALDVTIQAQILELIREMRDELNAAVMLITHDLAVIAEEADDVAVMYLGRIVEYGDVRTIVRNPSHPYTMGLLKSIPNLETQADRLYQIEGDVPSLTDIPAGCPFHPRCEFAVSGVCDVGAPPPMQTVQGIHEAACLRLQEVAETQTTETPEPKTCSHRHERSEDGTVSSSSSPPLLEIRNLSKFFPIHSKGFFSRKIGDVKACNGLSFSMERGETLGLVGESGCGKTTTARTILRAMMPTGGQILFHTRKQGVVDLARLTRKELKGLRKEMQMIFQDPFASLNPRMTVGSLVAEPLVINRIGTQQERDERVAELLEKVGLRPEHMTRYPHSFSGGQRQRIGIARALIMEPSLLVCDEAVSALDVSVQAQIINLLMDLQKEMDLTYIFVAHDLSVVKHICNRLAVMYAGSIVEIGDVNTIFEAPMHPYTQGLLSAIPHLDPDKKMQSELHGEVLDITKLPPGCPFQPRCKLATEQCRNVMPDLTERNPFQRIACLNV